MKNLYRIAVIVVLLVALSGIIPAQAQEEWDKSSVVVSGTCSDGEVTFVVLNHGGDMQGPVEWRVYVNDTLFTFGTTQLTAGGSMELTYTLQGSMRFEVDQRPGHPGSSQPRVTIDSCGDAIPTPTATPKETDEPPTLTPTQTPKATEIIVEDPPTPFGTPTSTLTATATPTAIATTTVIPTEVSTQEPTGDVEIGEPPSIVWLTWLPVVTK